MPELRLKRNRPLAVLHPESGPQWVSPLQSGTTIPQCLPMQPYGWCLFKAYAIRSPFPSRWPATANRNALSWLPLPALAAGHCDQGSLNAFISSIRWDPRFFHQPSRSNRSRIWPLAHPEQFHEPYAIILQGTSLALEADIANAIK